MIWIETIIQRYSVHLKHMIHCFLWKQFLVRPSTNTRKGGSKYTFPKSVTARTCFLYHLSSDFQKQNVLPKVSCFIDRKLLQLENYSPIMVWWKGPTCKEKYKYLFIHIALFVVYFKILMMFRHDLDHPQEDG